MQKSTMGTSFQRNDSKKKGQVGKSSTGAVEMNALSANQAYQRRERAARVSKLRAQVKSGTDAVDSKALAASMLRNKTRFS